MTRFAMPLFGALLALTPAVASADALAVSVGATFVPGKAGIDVGQGSVSLSTIDTLAVAAATADYAAVANATAADGMGLSGSNANAGAVSESADVTSRVSVDGWGFTSEVLIEAEDEGDEPPCYSFPFCFGS